MMNIAMTEHSTLTTHPTASDLPGLEIIPQRAPFLFVDAICDGIPGQFAHSIYSIAADHPVFEGHFPHQAVWPGVLLIENMAQTACWVMAAQPNSKPVKTELYVLARVNQCTFKRLVQANDILHTQAQLSRDLGQFCIFSCEIRVANELVATAELLVARRSTEPTETIRAQNTTQ